MHIQFEIFFHLGRKFHKNNRTKQKKTLKTTKRLEGCTSLTPDPVELIFSVFFVLLDQAVLKEVSRTVQSRHENHGLERTPIVSSRGLETLLALPVFAGEQAGNTNKQQNCETIPRSHDRHCS